jgi:hypothetical protein
MTSEYETEVRERTAALLLDVAIEKNRPFMILKPLVFKDGDMWCCLYGDNIMEGVAAFGKTPDEATREFDRVWVSP